MCYGLGDGRSLPPSSYKNNIFGVETGKESRNLSHQSPQRLGTNQLPRNYFISQELKPGLGMGRR